jgi:hypothetical protein
MEGACGGVLAPRQGRGFRFTRHCSRSTSDFQPLRWPTNRITLEVANQPNNLNRLVVGRTRMKNEQKYSAATIVVPALKSHS